MANPVASSVALGNPPLLDVLLRSNRGIGVLLLGAKPPLLFSSPKFGLNRGVTSKPPGPVGSLASGAPPGPPPPLGSPKFGFGSLKLGLVGILSSIASLGHASSTSIPIFASSGHPSSVAVGPSQPSPPPYRLDMRFWAAMAALKAESIICLRLFSSSLGIFIRAWIFWAPASAFQVRVARPRPSNASKTISTSSSSPPTFEITLSISL